MRKLVYGSEKLDDYVDDVLAHTPNWQGHILVIRHFLTKVRETKLTLKPTKCSIGFYRIPYLGHCVCNNTLKQKVEIVSKI